MQSAASITPKTMKSPAPQLTSCVTSIAAAGTSNAAVVMPHISGWNRNAGLGDVVVVIFIG